MRFAGTKDYIATDDLKIAGNAAIVLERPLQIKSEPETGKTVLADELARSLGPQLITRHIKSTTRAQHGLYEYDAISRLHHSQISDPRISDIQHDIKSGRFLQTFTRTERPVLQIDQIDRADIESPDDLLLELDRKEFFVHETGETIRPQKRPFVIITFNNEKELPNAFLTRYLFHYIRFPGQRP